MRASGILTAMVGELAVVSVIVIYCNCSDQVAIAKQTG